MAPAFFFMLHEMRERSAVQPVSTRAGFWQPPTRHGDNVLVGDITQSLWYFNGLTPTRIHSEQCASYLQCLVEYRTMSIYYDYDTSKFWSVACDATQRALGGVGGDEDEEHDDDDDELHYWRRVGFESRCENDLNALYASTITEGGGLDELVCQRLQQSWCDTLLPRSYHKPHTAKIAAEHEEYGGLIGQLNLILALFAFSVRPRDVPATLQYCMHNGSWRGPNLQPDRIGRGWERTSSGRRGLVVRILYMPEAPGSNPQNTLAEFEEGVLGKIID